MLTDSTRTILTYGWDEKISILMPLLYVLIAN